MTAPRVLGVDDFALRRGRSCATMLIDAETGRRAGVLPGRTADVVEAWLRDHPGVAVVSRDGSGAYGEAVRRALPGAHVDGFPAAVHSRAWTVTLVTGDVVGARTAAAGESGQGGAGQA
jgi:Transposase